MTLYEIAALSFLVVPAFVHPAKVSSSVPQNRHPERSASRTYRITETLCAEPKDLGDAKVVTAVRSFLMKTPRNIKIITASRAKPALEKPLLRKLYVVEKFVVVETGCRREETNHLHLLGPAIAQHVYLSLGKQNRAPRLDWLHHSFDHHLA